MKPDLGLMYRDRGISSDTALMFYNMAFHEIDFVAPHSYSTMYDVPVEGTVYAALFDFDDDIFAHIVARFSAEARKRFGESLNGMRFPFRVTLPAQITCEVIECHLGELQRGANESFVPLVIRSVGWP